MVYAYVDFTTLVDVVDAAEDDATFGVMPSDCKNLKS
jgi:hypothetical protein